MHVAAIRVRRNPFKLSRRRMAPTHMQFHDNLPQIPEAPIYRIPGFAALQAGEVRGGLNWYELVQAFHRVAKA